MVDTTTPTEQIAEFTEKDPTKWKDLIAAQAPWATITIPTKTGIICFDTYDTYMKWKATN